MEKFSSPPRCPGKRWRIFCFALMVFVLGLMTGCATGGKPQYNVENYLLNYPTASWGNPEKLAASIKFNRFSIATAYNSTNMVFRSDAYSLDYFNYSRWAVNPADLISDNLLADMRGSNQFAAVYSRYDTEDARFIISGGIEEFYLRMNNSNKTAFINITISLQDTREKETGKRIMFQKKYTREEPLQESSPRGYCEAASQAMQILSRAIISDIYAAVKTAHQ